MIVPSPPTSFQHYAAAALLQPAVLDALHQFMGDDAIPQAAGPHLELIAELAAARIAVLEV